MSYLAAFHHYPILHALRNEIESLFYFHLFAEVRNLKRAPRHHAQHFEDGNDLHLIALEVYRVELHSRPELDDLQRRKYSCLDQQLSEDFE